MAQIFVSHSSKDARSIELLSKAFASTPVRGVFEEFDAIIRGPSNAAHIAQNIRESNAVFVLLGQNVEALKHTRDWIGWENGFAAAEALRTNKDIWVLEPITEMEDMTVVIPHLRHYVCFDVTDDRWQGYLAQVIASYDDSHLLKAVLAGAGLGGGAALVGEADTTTGALWGAGAGLLLAALSSPAKPVGFPICCPQCSSFYNVHLASLRMRCPVCNARLVFPGR